MENINDKVYKTIDKLIKESLWGQTVTVDELIHFLYEEIDEFAVGARKQDMNNMYEEASDVLMLILYIILKEQKDVNENPISRITKAIEKKLKQRYAVFFEENNIEEDEEIYWKKTKYIEKEIGEYLYCSNLECEFCGKSNDGQLKYFHEKGVECKCGYKKNLSGENVFFFRIKERRKLMSEITRYYSEFCSGREFAYDHFFLSKKEDYFKVLRFAIEYPIGYMALQDYLGKRVMELEGGFTLFLISPLLRYMEQSTNGGIPLLKLDVINNFTISTINRNYIEFKNSFLANIENAISIWGSYCLSVLNGTLIKLQYNGDGYEQDSAIQTKKYTTNLEQKNEKTKTIIITVQTFNVEIENKIVATIQTEEECSNFDWLRLIYLVKTKFDITYNEKNVIYLKGIREKNLKKHLDIIIKDIFPEIKCLMIFD